MVYNLHCSHENVRWNNGSEHSIVIPKSFMALEMNNYIQVYCGDEYNIDKIIYYTELGDFVFSYSFKENIIENSNGTKIRISHIISIVPLSKSQGLVIITDYNTLVMCKPNMRSVEVGAPSGITLIMLDIDNDMIRILCQDGFGRKEIYKYNDKYNILEKE